MELDLVAVGCFIQASTFPKEVVVRSSNNQMATLKVPFVYAALSILFM